MKAQTVGGFSPIFESTKGEKEGSRWADFSGGVFCSLIYAFLFCRGEGGGVCFSTTCVDWMREERRGEEGREVVSCTNISFFLGPCHVNIGLALVSCSFLYPEKI